MTRHQRLAMGLGSFDGFHLGHQEIARQSDVLLTFDPHPDIVLKKPSFQYLTTIAELKTYVPNLMVMPFSQSISRLSPVDFLNHLYTAYRPLALVVGYDFGFGYRREGTVKTMTGWAQSNGVRIVEVQPYCRRDALPVKGKIIRQCLASGHIDQAIDLMGHDYLIAGKVIPGDRRGHHVGFPTVNLAIASQKLVPMPGVYRSKTMVQHTSYPSITYIGSRPTFDDPSLRIETHILAFNQNLYGQTIALHLMARIRDQQSFLSLDALRQNIRQDCVTAWPDHH